MMPAPVGGCVPVHFWKRVKTVQFKRTKKCARRNSQEDKTFNIPVEPGAKSRRTRIVNSQPDSLSENPRPPTL
jgi:hypothetical protein